MGLFDFFNRTASKKNLDPTINNTSMMKPMFINGTTLPDYKTGSYIKDGFLGNADIYAIVSFLSRKAASIPWYAYSLNEGDKARNSLLRYKALSKNLGPEGAYGQAILERKNAYSENIVVNTPLAKILERPNKYQAQDQFLENLFGYRFLSGEGNIYGNDGNGTSKQFLELNVLPTQFLEIYPDKNDLYGLSGFRLNVSGGIDLPKENVLMWKSWNPEFNAETRSHMRGVSPLRAAYKTLRMSNAATDASAMMSSNGGAKGAITPKVSNGIVAHVSPEQASQIKDVVNTDLNGIDNKGRVTVLQTPWDYLNFGLSSVDMELVKSLQYTLHQWCRVFGLPAVIFDTDVSSYNNYQNAMRDLITNTIIPVCCTLRDELNNWLVPRFGENVYIDFDITSLAEMQQDLERLVRSLRDANWLTLDEKRVAMNYEEKGGPWGTSYLNQGLVPIEYIGMDLNVSQTDGNGSNNGSADMGNGNDTVSQTGDGEDVQNGAANAE